MEKGLNDNAQDDAESHRILTELNLILHRDFDKVRFHQDRAYALNPNDPLIVFQRGEMGIWLGDAAGAVGWIEKVLLLDPSEAERRVKHLGQAHYVARHYQEAIDAFKRSPRLGKWNMPISPPAMPRSAMMPRPRPRACSKAIRNFRSKPCLNARPIGLIRTASTKETQC